MKRLPRSRLIRLRFVYRDKNTALRTEQTPPPVRAKARLRAQTFREPLAIRGALKLGSPTVQRTGLMVFLQLSAIFGWHTHRRKGDITGAFLQGRKQARRGVFGELYLLPPARPLKGVALGSLLRVLKSVYGLPDAPRA